MQALSPPGSPNMSPRSSPRSSHNGDDCDKESTSSSEGDSPKPKRPACTNSEYGAISRTTRSTLSNRAILDSEEEDEEEIVEKVEVKEETGEEEREDDDGDATQNTRKKF